MLTAIYYPHIVRIYIGRRVRSQDTPAAQERRMEGKKEGKEKTIEDLFEHVGRQPNG